MVRDRTVSAVCVSYRVDFASGAWSQLRMLERALFQHVTEKLRDVAAEAPRLAGAPDADTSLTDLMRVDCGEIAAFYQVDHHSCAVLVVKLERAGSPVAASG
jgi:hypothetical protein